MKASLAEARLLTVLAEVRRCTVCAPNLPLGPKPLLSASSNARVLIIGQAPGKAAHLSGVPWSDRSGDRLRGWLGIDSTHFYDPALVAIVPIGFCYPGTGSTGDLPPRPECAPLWHPRIMPLLQRVKLTIYLGVYAFQARFGTEFRNLSTAAERYRDLLPECVVLPHPSPRNSMWASQRPWFQKDLLPALQRRVQEVLA